jgi:hypothetical protein
VKQNNISRRDFAKKAAYVAPAVLSLQAFSAVAKAGSNDDQQGKDGSGKDKRAPKKPPKSKKGR